ncbi:hypothetical protein OEZ86_013807 [Tetradesmus obliquus]|nr:hypothetical protein OEZ86_013807 [Tetradesmus obliquus]
MLSTAGIVISWWICRNWTDKESSLCLRVESGDDSKLGESCDSVLLMACGTDPFHLVDAGVAAAAALSGGAAPRAAKHLPASLDGFGWCTWDAFYSTVSARGLVEGLGSLAAGGLSPQLLIIDDGWQLTDVDPPYGKAPTAQLADKLAGEGTAAAQLFDGPREMVLETQDTFYQENAKLLAEASGQMQQEVRNLFPTVANTGVISHHHAPPAATWDAPAEAVIAAKEEEIAASRDSRDGGAASPAAADGSMRPDWAEARRNAAKSTVPSERRPLLSRRQQQQDSSASTAAAAAGDVEGSSDGQQQQQPKKKKGGGVLATAHLEELISDPKHAAEVVGAELKATAAEAEAALGQAKVEAELRLEAARAEAKKAMKRAIQKASPTPRQQFILIRWAQKAAGALVGLATAGFLLFYQWVVEPAPPNSLRVKAFAALTQGVLRGAMLTFFASASDFTRRLTSVEANAKFARLDAGPEEDWEATPADFRGVVQHIKQKFGIRYVYCWHGLPAYWGGVMPGTPSLAGVTGSSLVYPKPTNSIAEVEPSLMWSPAVLAGVGIATDPGALYSAMHSYLASSAVDGVKVDCQAGVGLVGSALGGGPAAAREFQAALEASIATHFPGNHAINCMCHSSENFYRFVATAVARVSDDYYPRDPASSTPHIGACAFNSLYLGALVQPDWDMFQSAHPAGVLHGMARAVSGGAVYVSDKPGQHDFALLRRLVLPDGGVLRAALPGRPTRDCLFADVLRDRQTLLKVWNANPVVGIVGVFNLQGASWDRQRRKFHVHDKRGSTLTTAVTPGDVETLRQPAHSSAAADADADGDGGSSRWADAAAAAGVDGAAAAAAPPQQQQQQQQQLFAMYRYDTEELAVVPSSGSISVALGPSGSDLVWALVF